MPISTLDIAWSAGFLEGEGWFGITPMGNSALIKIIVGQKQREPLERLRRLYGGNIHSVNSYKGTGKFYHWQAHTRRSVQIMMTIYPLMSPVRKEQIERCLERWKSHSKMTWPKELRISGTRTEREDALKAIAQARIGRPRNNTSGFRGVIWSSQKLKWQARIQIDRKQIHLGFFDDIRDAARAYRIAAIAQWGLYDHRILTDEQIDNFASEGEQNAPTRGRPTLAAAGDAAAHAVQPASNRSRPTLQPS